MTKVSIGARTILYPLPAVLVGANVEGKPNFTTCAWCGIVNSTPPVLSVSLRHQRHTMKGIKQNGTFSVNIPSAAQVKETDYCGLVSGKDVDKVAACRFTVFYGPLENTPMIDECPVNIECSVQNVLDLGSHVMIVGLIKDVHVTDSCLTNNEPDVNKINPFLLVGHPASKYCKIGKAIGTAYNTGKKIKDNI